MSTDPVDTHAEEEVTSAQGTGISNLLWENPGTTAYAPLVRPLSVETMPIIVIPSPSTCAPFGC